MIGPIIGPKALVFEGVPIAIARAPGISYNVLFGDLGTAGRKFAQSDI